jgi:hypothetical protein
MSITVIGPEDKFAERWRRWQIGYARSNRRSAIYARIAFTVVLTAAAVWLALQLMASPAWS